ncbi:membrane hypothetical protein [uncultured Mycobacterium sp.]|uniref:Transmembrane protein n=1 Tax=uncultured Mycobacterium sp. TaxID=171292 RepID=A0A1Y5PKF7_9MYCO|nr:membrane hypothetical protein [uncultured Mycobacterium sp.]
MPGKEYGIRSRLAVFWGAASGGFFSAMLFVVAMAYRSASADYSRIPPVGLFIVIVISGLMVLGGSWLLFVSRTPGRTFGVTVIICALSPWIVFGTVAIQSWLWRL